MRNENNSVGEHHLERELDGANNMMCFWVDDTEISHYLMSDFVHYTLQREKREYAACEEYTRRKEEGI